MSNPKPIPYASKWTLIEDNTEVEYRNNISWSPAGLGKTPKRRVVRSKTYEASFYDEDGDDSVMTGTDYVVVPEYVNTILGWANLPNPENFDNVGVNKNQWHIDSKSYTKELSSPNTRRIRVTWVNQGDWTDYNE